MEHLNHVLYRRDSDVELLTRQVSKMYLVDSASLCGMGHGVKFPLSK